MRRAIVVTDVSRQWEVIFRPPRASTRRTTRPARGHRLEGRHPVVLIGILIEGSVGDQVTGIFEDVGGERGLVINFVGRSIIHREDADRELVPVGEDHEERTLTSAGAWSSRS